LQTQHRPQVTIERIVRMLIMIAYEPKQWTAGKLAESFHTNIRTIYRDIARLQNAGIYVYHEAEGGYYFTDSMARLPIATSAQDQLWLSLLPGLLRGMANTSATSAENLLHYVLRRSGLQGSLKEELTKYILWQSPLGTMTSLSLPLHLTELLDGMLHRTTLAVTYAMPNQSSTSSIQFDPYYLLFRANGPYVIGFHHERNAFRILKISRMAEIKSTTKTFIRDDTALQVLDAQTSFGIDNSGEVIDAVLAYEQRVAVYVREELQATGLTWHEEWDGNRMFIHVRVRDNLEWMRWILQYGPEVEVIAPLSLRERVREKVLQMSAKYTDSST